VPYVKETDDWQTAGELLERALTLAATAAVRYRLEENIAAVRSNLRYGTCWFCGENPAHEQSAYDLKMHGQVERTYGRIRWKTLTIEVKGRSRLPDRCNTGRFDGEGALVDGYQTHSVVDGYGCGNTFRANHSDLGGVPGYAIYVTDQNKCDSAANVVTSDNTVTRAGKGLTNIPVTG
jgi:hypothetical protein